MALRKQWEDRVRTVREGWRASVHACLCSAHFEEKCFDLTGQTVRLRVGSVPTIFSLPTRSQRRGGRSKKLPHFTDIESDAASVPHGMSSMSVLHSLNGIICSRASMNEPASVAQRARAVGAAVQ